MESLNESLLPESVCFGCGRANAHGLHAQIFRDGDRTDGLVARFRPTALASGFEGLAHGGAVYTVFDCTAGWTFLVLRGERRYAPILKRGSMTYHRPTRIDREMSIASRITKEGAPGEPVVVHVEGRDPAGELLAEGDFELVPLATQKVKRVLGVERLPATWAKLLDDG